MTIYLKQSKVWASRFSLLLLAFMMLSTTALSPLISAEDGLPEKEVKALTDYPNWVGACGAAPGDEADEELDLAAIAKKYDLHSIIVTKVNGEEVAEYHSSNAPSSPASTMKLIIADVLLRQNGLNLNKRVPITRALYYSNPNTDPLKGSSTTLKVALTKMLEESSDVGANVLIKYLGGVSGFTDKAKAAGYEDTEVKSLYSDPVRGGGNTSTIADQAKAMSHLQSTKGSEYDVARKASSNAAKTDNKFKVASEANKWGGTSKVAGNVGVFNINGAKYIVGLYHEGGSWEDDPAQKSIHDGTGAIVEALGKTQPAGSGSSSSSTSSSSGDPTTYTYISAGIIPKKGKKVMASTFGGEYSGGKWHATNDKQNPGGANNDDNGAGNSSKGIVGKAGYAELSVNVGSGDYSALGKLPQGTKLQITYKGKSVIAEKLDVGAGGDAHPLIDLWWETARLLDFTGGNGKVTLHVVPKNTPTTPVNGSASDSGDSEEDTPKCCANTAPSSDAALVGRTKAEKAFNYFVQQKGLSAKASAGIVGNMMTESGGQTEKLDTRAHNDISGTHDGIVQWSTGRWAALKDHEKDKFKDGVDEYDLEIQLDYVWYELTHGYKSTLSGLKGADSAAEAATIFNEHYEISGDSSGKREANATKIFTKYGGGASPSTASGSTTSPTSDDSGGGCPAVDAGGDADMMKTIKVSTKGKFITLPKKYSCDGRTTRIDSRIATNIAYLVNNYKMCADDGLANGHKSHGAGLGIDMRPKDGNSKAVWKETVEQAARDMGWYGDSASDSKGSKSSCASYSGYGTCVGGQGKIPKWVRWIGYNGDVDHGDPWHVFGGSYAHIHIGWQTPNNDGVSASIIAEPRDSVYAFPAPIPDDLKSLVD